MHKFHLKPSKTQRHSSLWSWLAVELEGFLKKLQKSVFREKEEKIFGTAKTKHITQIALDFCRAVCGLERAEL